MKRIGHRLAEQRSIALHAAVAEVLRRDPERIEEARVRVERWLRTGSVHREYAEAWQRLLSRPLQEICAALVDPDEEMRALRQTSPFAGFVGPRERWRIHDEVRRRMQP